ncbi:MAG: ABC transporter substrate-binding protein [Dorea sp.]|nr:ABC transporter substrate-binding protein [Dorea sp.]
MKKRLVAVLCVISMLVMTILAGCSQKSSEENADDSSNAEEVAESVMNIPIQEIPASMVPRNESDSNLLIFQALFDPLWFQSADEIDYYLAKEATVSDDGLQYTITLNDGMTWSDGEAITTEDVAFTIDYYQTIQPSAPSVILSGYTYEIVDDQTIVLTREEYAGGFLTEFGKVRLIPKHFFDGDVNAVEGNEKLQSVDLVSSGPYTITEWNAGESLVCTARDDYYRGKASIETLNMIVMPDTNTQLAAFENGEISYIEVTDGETLAKYDGNDDYNVYSFPAGKILYLQVNPDNELFANEDAKKAISLTLDREEIAKTATGSDKIAVPTSNIFASTQTYYSDIDPYEHDVEKAKELAEQSGLTEIPLTLIYNNERAYQEQAAVAIQQELEAIGLTVEVEGYDYSTYYSKVFGRMYGTIDEEWTLAVNHCTDLVGERSSSQQSMLAWGVTGASDETIAMVQAACSELDESKKVEMFKEFQEALRDENCTMPFMETNEVLVSQKNVTGLDAVKRFPIFADYTKLNVE